VISPSQDRYIHIGEHKINAHTDIHALSGIEPTIPAFERAKTVHALDRAATVIGGGISPPFLNLAVDGGDNFAQQFA
jgi:hypothetical protein